jgi:CheY-like chemotaxis protein
MKILVADDLKANRYLLESALKSAGYQVISANNGLDALNILRKSPVDMIITDVLMPKMDGFQLCREVKADENLKNIPFIFYTASYTNPEDQKIGLDLGADRYIIKPVDTDEFLSAIGDILSEANSIVPSEPETGVVPEDSFLQDYNRRIFAQLEKKIEELEEKNRELVESRRALAESERM